MEQESIVRYWHAVELLQPQSAPALEKRSSPYTAFIHDTPIRHPVPPWASGSVLAKQELPERRVWSHTLYAHLYDSRDVGEKLKEFYGADHGYREPQHRESALFAAKFTADGRMAGWPMAVWCFQVKHGFWGGCWPERTGPEASMTLSDRPAHRRKHC